jgi:glycosyltransferase involved in cell wall biosynthesis
VTLKRRERTLTRELTIPCVGGGAAPDSVASVFQHERDNDLQAKASGVTMAHIVTLLARRDQPTDAVEDYCHLLRTALRAGGLRTESAHVRWQEQGWGIALADLARQKHGWRGAYVMPQYTAYKWSRRGFPLGFLLVVAILKRRGARVGVVYHDPVPYDGRRPIDVARRNVQIFTMRQAGRLADALISTLPPERVPWMRDPVLRRKATLIPVGSNVATPDQIRHASGKERMPTIAVFGVTTHRQEEAEALALVARETARQVGRLRLRVFGRGAEQAEDALARGLSGSAVELEVHHLVPPELAGQLLMSSHAELFLRSGVSTRRTSVIAGIACGLPIVGYAGCETGFPIVEAGVRLVPLGDVRGLVRELSLVLRDGSVRTEMERRSRLAASRYFSWDAIALRYVEVFDSPTRAEA